MNNIIILKLKLVLQPKKRIRWSSNFSLSSLKCSLHLFVVNVVRHVLKVKQAFSLYLIAGSNACITQNIPYGINYELNSKTDLCGAI